MYSCAPILLSNLQQDGIYRAIFIKIPPPSPIPNFMKIRPVGAELIQTRKDRRTNMPKLIGASRYLREIA